MRNLLFLIPIVLFCTSCTEKHEINHLKNQRSLYLKQHSKNPIWWYPWNNKALKYAKKNKKLIFVSVGYSACHWCHVMEKKVFEYQDVADILNKDFVSIKIDREERPDLDSYFMKAAQGMTGRGGWPNSMIFTPEMKPIFAASYIPKKEFKYILNELQTAWIEKTDKLEERGQKVHEWLKQKPISELSYEKDKKLFEDFYAQYTHIFDPIFGGKRIGKSWAPKFPINTDLRLLLRYHFHKRDPQPLRMVEKTLSTIAKSALFDHIEGGFHRYSTDRKWEVPHFEKMLYDQASFIHAYLDLYQFKPKEIYRNAIQRTISFLLRNFQGPRGGFYSSQDADSQGQEGLYYTWQDHEVQSLLNKEEFQLFNDTYFLTAKNKTLHFRRTLIKKTTFQKSKLIPIEKKLLKGRSQRPSPTIDTKIITSWNGLILSALSRVARIWPSNEMDQLLRKNFDFIIHQHLKRDGSLVRRSIGGQVDNKAILDDYAFLIDALIEFYQAHFDEKYLNIALKLQKKQDQLFLDEIIGNYLLTTDSADFLSDYKVFEDQVRPSGIAVTYFNLLRFSHFYEDEKFSQKAQKLLDSYPDGLRSKPYAFSHLLLGLDFKLAQSKELVIAGSLQDCKKATQEISESFFPYVLFSCNRGNSKLPLNKKKLQNEGRVTYYVCEKGFCKAPTHSFDEAKKLLL